MLSSLPLYRSHKIVGAAKIADVDHNHKVIHLELPDGTRVERAWLDRFTGPYTPSVGKWFVEYEDGFMSISPGDAFEGAHTSYDPATSAESVLDQVKEQLDKLMPSHDALSADHQAIAKMVGHVHDGATPLRDTVAAYIEAMRVKILPAAGEMGKPGLAADQSSGMAEHKPQAKLVGR